MKLRRRYQQTPRRQPPRCKSQAPPPTALPSPLHKRIGAQCFVARAGQIMEKKSKQSKGHPWTQCRAFLESVSNFMTRSAGGYGRAHLAGSHKACPRPFCKRASKKNELLRLNSAMRVYPNGNGRCTRKSKELIE